MSTPTIFLLGSTGYVGSQFLMLLGEAYPTLLVRALLRPGAEQRVEWLHRTHPNLSIVEGSLDDVVLVEDQARRADIVINVANCDHIACTQAILSGLIKRSLETPQYPPTLLHVSGTGIVSDNARGELAQTKKYSDLDLDLNSLPNNNPHLQNDIPIVNAGTDQEHPIRTAILFPGFIYGIGDGIQRKPAWARILLEFAKNAGHVGTWGPGLNTTSSIHVKDVASAILTVLVALVEGRADTGADGLYFVGCNETRPSWLDVTSAMGNHLYRRGIIREPKTRPYSDEFIQSFKDSNLSRGIHSDGWQMLGANNWVESHRLQKFGWDPVETKKNDFFTTLEQSVDVVLE